VTAQIKHLFVVIVWLFSELLGYAAPCLILYAIIADYVGEPWRPIEKWASFISAALTLLGTIATAASVYFYSNVPAPKPREHSTRIVAPIVIASALIALGFLVIRGDLSGVLVSAFGLLAISGAIKRLLPYP
jgi:hypothetical protein